MGEADGGLYPAAGPPGVVDRGKGARGGAKLMTEGLLVQAIGGGE